MSDLDRGVMGAEYAQGRSSAPHLRFRYRVRAKVAVDAYHERQGRAQSYNVIELGAAEGKTLLEIRELLGGRGSFTGIELSPELLAAAPRLPENTQLIRGDVMQLPTEVEAGKYDLCTALAVLEHLPDPIRCLKEAFRVLRPAGVLVATCPSPLWDHVAGKLGMVDDDAHEQEMDAKTMISMAKEAGFVDIVYRPFMWAPVGFLPYLKIDVPADLSMRIDAFVHRAKLLDFSFVNQLLIAQKPK